MTQIGEIALWVALVLSVWGAGAAFIGGRTRRGDLVLSAERSVLVVANLSRHTQPVELDLTPDPCACEPPPPTVLIETLPTG